MKRPPLISVILPTLNGSRYLAESVESCLAQTYPNWELIIVDDGSTDDTPAIIARFTAQDPRIRSLRHETNRRTPAALNSGCRQSKGDYLTWTSDDNLFRPRALETMLRFLEARPDVGFVYSDYTIIDAQGQPLEAVYNGGPEFLIIGNCVGTSYLFRREVYEKVGPFAEDMFMADDYDYWLRVSAQFKMEPLHEDLYLFRRHSGSWTARRTADMIRVGELALYRNLPRLKWVNAVDRVWVLRRLAAQARARREWGLAAACYLRALPHVPGHLLGRLRNRHRGAK